MFAYCSKILISFFLTSTLVATVSAQTQSARYTITDLGAFTAQAINDAGQVVGTMGNKAVLYTNGSLIDITPLGGVNGEALGINNLGQVAGRVFICDFVDGNCVNGRTRAFIYDRGARTVLGTLGGRDSMAFDINDSGQVAGWADTAGSSGQISGQSHAFIFKNGLLEDIGVRSAADSTFASGINANGQVTGHGSSNTSNRGAFVYSNGSFLFFETQGIANDINSSGQVVGRFGGNDDGSGRAFLFSGAVRHDLGTLSTQHKFSSALAINNGGQVVGVSSPSFFSSDGERAFVYDGGAMQDLNTLVPATSGLVLTSASDINDAGQIVASGLVNGVSHAFLLTPTEPILLTESSKDKAIAVQSVAFLPGPFSITTPHNLSSDTRTRITLLARNMETSAGETVSLPIVQAEDAQRRIISLPVEFVGKVPGFSWLTQIVVRLPNELEAAGEVQVSVSFRGRMSNKAQITVATPTLLP